MLKKTLIFLTKNDKMLYKHYQNKKGKKMNYETAAYLLDKISEIQGVLIQKPPSLPTNFGYVISRIFLYAVILFLGFCFFRYENSEKIKNRISAGILGITLGYILATLFLFFSVILVMAFKTDEQNYFGEKYFAPFELFQIADERNKFNSERTEALKEEKEVLQEINKSISSNTKFSELGTAKKFLEKKEQILKAEYEKEKKISEKIMSISKKEVLLSVKGHDFLKKLNENQLEYLAKAVTFRTGTYKNFSELKISFDESSENNLPNLLKNNALVEDYINNLSRKVDKELAAEKI